MVVHSTWRDPILINTIGHTAGVVLFGVIIALLIRDWRTHGMRQIKLSLVAAVLAFGWNIGSLVVLASHDPSSQIIGIVAAASFSMLSMLPAVLLQVAVQGQPRLIVAAGYIVSACAVALHTSELFSSGMGLHQAGLVSIVFGYGILTVTVFLLGWRREGGVRAQRSEWISLGCLLLFTSSFLHFGYQHVSSPWSAEIAWHHVGIPVALIVLLRDYRILLLDTFIRFLVNSGIAAVYIAAVLVVSQRLRVWDFIPSNMFLTGIALGALCLSLILFAYLRNRLQTWASQVIFRRRSVDDCVQAIARLASSARSEDELLAQAAQQLATHLQTEQFAIVTDLTGKEAPAKPSMLFGELVRESRRDSFHAEAQIPLRFSSGDIRYLVVGARRGGRRYWSEDLEDMRRLAAAIVEQVERFRAEELKRLVSQAELRALQSQINPHFLFNALNTLYGTIDRRSREARKMVLNLAEIFRYFLQGHRAFIPLSEELRIVEAYLEIEALRLGDRLQTELIVSESARSTLIPILSIQPLVENAVKHGIAAKQGRGWVSVRADKLPGGLRVCIEDTGVGFERSQTQWQDGTGLGLGNVRRRLMLHYGSAAELQIQSSAAGTTITFMVPDPPSAGPVAAGVELEGYPLTAPNDPPVAQEWPV